MIPIFHDMMDWEQRKNGNFKQVEAELMDKLDSMVSDGKGDDNHRELFSLLLLEKIEQETWRETSISLVTSVTRLMERLLDYRDCIKGEEGENKKISGSVNLMNFYKSEVNKEDMYIRYIHKLCDLHLQAEDFTEAAFTLLLYWELLQWEDRALRDFLHYPSQSECSARRTSAARSSTTSTRGRQVPERPSLFPSIVVEMVSQMAQIGNKEFEFVCRGYGSLSLSGLPPRDSHSKGMLARGGISRISTGHLRHCSTHPPTSPDTIPAERCSVYPNIALQYQSL
ncbi:unnamed protein product [Boreogadus saida]